MQKGAVSSLHLRSQWGFRGETLCRRAAAEAEPDVLWEPAPRDETMRCGRELQTRLSWAASVRVASGTWCFCAVRATSHLPGLSSAGAVSPLCTFSSRARQMLPSRARRCVRCSRCLISECKVTKKKRIRRTGKQSLCSFSASGWSNSCGAKTGRVLAETVRTLSYCKFSQWRKRRKNVLFWASRRAADFNTACRVGQHSVLCWKILPVAWGEIPCRKMPKNAGKALVLPCVCGKTAL